MNIGLNFRCWFIQELHAWYLEILNTAISDKLIISSFEFLVIDFPHEIDNFFVAMVNVIVLKFVLRTL